MEAILNLPKGHDIKSIRFVIKFNLQRVMVKDTDEGKILIAQIQDLSKLITAYRTGLIKEKGVMTLTTGSNLRLLTGVSYKNLVRGYDTIEKIKEFDWEASFSTRIN
ncbi:Fructose-1 6-bisphosphatase class 3 [termite gut metagenome]|uniref:Fructose-1 6-bisphosphatase class 3 n=1 Tax=termite gut metagenome TaxID=433724 RepID=A0A5J4PZ13_9ZZZZ